MSGARDRVDCFPPDATAATALTPGDRVVLHALRRSPLLPDISETFLAEAPQVGHPDEAARGLGGLLATLSQHTRRDLRLRRNPDSGPSTDEQAILSLIAAVQQKDEARAGALADWLAEPLGRGGLLYFAEMLAAVFRDADLPLTLPRA